MPSDEGVSPRVPTPPRDQSDRPWGGAGAHEPGARCCDVRRPGHDRLGRPAVTIAEAKAQIEQLQVDAEALDQDYLAVKQQVDASKADLALKQQDAQAQAQKVDALRKQVGQAALAQFQDRNVDTAAQLLLDSDTEGFLSQVSTIEKVGANQNKVLQDFQQQRAGLADLQKSQQTELAALEKKESDLETLKAGSDKKLTEAKAVLAKLTTEQQQTLADAGPEADRARRPSRRARWAPRRTRGHRARGRQRQGPDGARLGGKQLGKPYSFGATGPSSFDCSGLTLGAWKAAASASTAPRRPSSATAGPSPSPTCSRATSSSTTAASATSRCTSATARSSTRRTRAPSSSTPSSTRCRSPARVAPPDPRSPVTPALLRRAPGRRCWRSARRVRPRRSRRPAARGAATAGPPHDRLAARHPRRPDRPRPPLRRRRSGDRAGWDAGPPLRTPAFAAVPTFSSPTSSRSGPTRSASA